MWLWHILHFDTLSDCNRRMDRHVDNGKDCTFIIIIIVEFLVSDLQKWPMPQNSPHYAYALCCDQSGCLKQHAVMMTLMTRHRWRLWHSVGPIFSFHTSSKSSQYSPPDFDEIITTARHKTFDGSLCVTDEGAGLQVWTPAHCITADLQTQSTLYLLTTNTARRRCAADSQSHDTHSVIICEIRSLFKPPQLHVFQRLHTSHRCDL